MASAWFLWIRSWHSATVWRPCRGGAAGDTLIPLAGELREFEMPRAIFSSGERTEWAAGLQQPSHRTADADGSGRVLKSDLRAIGGGSRAAFPFLRDTLVGLNVRTTNRRGAGAAQQSLFVRSHDFSGDTVRAWIKSGRRLSCWRGLSGRRWRSSRRVTCRPTVCAFGSGAGLHRSGKRPGADLEGVGAGLLINAILPRWWDVSQGELHGVALYQRAGEELLTASVREGTAARQGNDYPVGSHASARGGRVDRAVVEGRLFWLIRHSRRLIRFI